MLTLGKNDSVFQKKKEVRGRNRKKKRAGEIVVKNWEPPLSRTIKGVQVGEKGAIDSEFIEGRGRTDHGPMGEKKKRKRKKM